jgi:pimeloyl-ACP methyl ester carboxylesterase
MFSFYILMLLLIIFLFGLYCVLDPEKRELGDAERERLGGTYTSLSDGVTHYRLDGPDGGRPIVLVHGGTVPLWAWDKQIQTLKEEGYQILRYDMYGRGYSDRPATSYDRELYRRQLSELVDQLGLALPFDVMGCSLGGGTAINFTAQYPQKVRKLILISPVVNHYKIPSLFRIPVLGEFMVRIVGLKLMTRRFKSLIEGSLESKKYTKLYTEQMTYHGFQRSLLSMLRNDAISGDYGHSLQAVGRHEHAVLLIWGTADKEITQPMISKIQSYLPHLDYQPIDGAGHGIVFQKSDLVNALIRDFLR